MYEIPEGLGVEEHRDSTKQGHEVRAHTKQQAQTVDYRDDWVGGLEGVRGRNTHEMAGLIATRHIRHTNVGLIVDELHLMRDQLVIDTGSIPIEMPRHKIIRIHRRYLQTPVLPDLLDFIKAIIKSFG